LETLEEVEPVVASRAGRGAPAARDAERIARVLEAAAEGDFRVRFQVDGESALGRIAAAANRLVARNARLAREMTRISRRINIDGRLSERTSPSLLPGAFEVDLVLIDVMMPEIDGLETTRQIRRHPGMSDLPIVALTAKALPGARERCLEAGCSDFATKPIGPEALIALLQKWMLKTR
jgi:CheY-like chemotaxis protein